MGKGFSDYVPIENLPDELSAVYGARSSQTMDASLEQARLRASRLQVLSDQYNAPLPGQGIVDQLKQTATQFGNAFLNADFAKSNVFNLASQGASGLASMLPDTSPTPTKYGDVVQSPLATVPINAVRGVLTGASKYLGGIGQAQATMGQGNILQDPVGTGMNIVGGAASGFASAVPFNAYSEVASETAKATLPDSAQQPLATLPVVGDVTLPGMIGLGASLKAPLSGGEQLLGDLTGKALSKGLGVVRNATRGLFDKASLGIPGAGTLARDNELLVASISTQLEDAIAQTNTSLETLRKIPVSSGRVPLRQLQETESVETGLVLTKSLIDAGFHPSDVSNLLDATVFNSSNSQFSRGAGAWEPLASKPEIKTLRDSLAKVSELPKIDLTASNSTLFLHGSPNPYDTVSPSSLNPFDRDGIGLYLTDAREIAQQYAGNSGQLRQVRVPNTFDILDVNNLTSPDFEAIASALNTMRRNGLSSLERVMTGTDLEQGFKASKFADPNDPGALVRYINNLLPTSSRVATDAISPSMQQPNLATGVLALAGYDGLRFMHPAGDMAREAYLALSIFPTSLNMIQNAETKQWMGASLGGLADRFLPKAPGAERAAGAAVGGVTGFMNPEGLSQGLPGTQDQGSNAGTPQEPTLGQRLSGAATGAVIGSQVPGALRKVLGREGGQGLRLPGAGVVEPPVRVDSAGNPVNVILRAARMQGVVSPRETNSSLDAIIRTPAVILNTKIFDRFEPLRAMQEAGGGQAYTLARLLPGTERSASQFVRDEIGPAVENLTDIQKTALQGYLREMDSLDRAMFTGKKLETAASTPAELVAAQDAVNNRVSGSEYTLDIQNRTRFGLGDQQALGRTPIQAAPLTQIQQSLEAALNNDRNSISAVQQAAQQIWDTTTKLRQKLLDSGLWDQETFDLFEQEMKHYVKYDVQDYLGAFTEKPGLAGATQQLSVRDRLLQHMTDEGTLRNSMDPVSSIINQSRSVFNLVNRNEIAKELESLQATVPGFQTALRPKLPNQAVPPNDVVFEVWQNGKKVEYLLDKSYEDLIKVSGDTLGPKLKLLNYALGGPLLKAGATSANIGWVPRNIFRDAYLMLTRNSGVGRAGGSRFGEGTRELFNAYKDLLTNSGNADIRDLTGLGVIGENLFDGLTPLQIQAKLRGDSVLASGAQEIKSLSDAGNWAEAMVKRFQQAGTAVEELAGKAKIPQFIQASEAAPRLAEFRIASRRGMSPAQSAISARNVTMDFDRAGTFSKAWNQWVPFFNVALQGPENLIRRDFAKGNRMATATSIMTLVALPKLVAEAWNQSQFPDEYAEVPDYIKNSSLVIMLGRNPDQANGTPGAPRFLYAPVPQEVQGLTSLLTAGMNTEIARNASLAGGNALRARAGMTPVEGPDEGKIPPESWSKVLLDMLSSLNPLQGVGMVPLPPVAKALIENQTNYDTFRGQQIVPDVVKTLPPEEQSRPWTTAFAKGLSRALAKVPTPQGINITPSPAKVEHFITSMTGGLGQQALDATEAGSNLLNKGLNALGQENFGEPALQSRTSVTGIPGLDPLIGAFYRQVGGADTQKLRDRARQTVLESTRYAIVNLRADPNFKALDATQQVEDLRKLSLEVDALVRNSQPAQVFGSLSTSTGPKYIGSSNRFEDKKIDKAIQLTRKYLNELQAGREYPISNDDLSLGLMYGAGTGTTTKYLDPITKFDEGQRSASIDRAVNDPAIRERMFAR